MTNPQPSVHEQFRACYLLFATGQAEKDRQERMIEEYQAQVTLHESAELKQKIVEVTTQRDAAEAACGEAAASIQQLRPRLHFWQPGEQLPEV